MLTLQYEEEEEIRSVHLQTIGSLERKLEESKLKSEAIRQEWERAKTREISDIEQKHENFLQGFKVKLSEAVSEQKKVDVQYCRQVNDKTIENANLKKKLADFTTLHSDFVAATQSREEKVEKERKENAKDDKSNKRKIKKLKKKLMLLETRHSDFVASAKSQDENIIKQRKANTKNLKNKNRKIQDLKNDLRKAETRHYDFVATLKSLLCEDSSSCSNGSSASAAKKRIDDLTKSLNEMIRIDLEVKEEPVEVKEEVDLPVISKEEASSLQDIDQQ
jgi:hypothetical protein